jgi:hypothetical protein
LSLEHEWFEGGGIADQFIVLGQAGRGRDDFESSFSLRGGDQTPAPAFGPLRGEP